MTPFVEVSEAIVPEAEVRSEMFPTDIVVVASVVVPIATSVLVLVLLTDVRLVKSPFTAEKLVV